MIGRSSRDLRRAFFHGGKHKFNLELLEQRQLLAAGTLDLSFGAGGKVTTDFTSPVGGEARHAVVVQADGKIVAVGDSEDVGGVDFAVARFNPDGSPDFSFGDGGTVTTDFSSTDSARSVAVQSDGKIVVAGSIVDAFGLSQFAVVRYNTDGSLDNSFGTGGAVFTAFDNDSMANAVAIQSDGRIIVAGGELNVPAAPGGGTNIAIARYNTNGSLDGSFGAGGKLSTFAGSLDAESFEAASLAIQPDGKLVIAGMYENFPMVARFQSDGTEDFGFSGDGYQLQPLGVGGTGRAFSVAVQPDGKIVFGGASGTLSTNVAIGRLNADGTIDGTFAVVDEDLASDLDRANSIALQADGKIVAAATDGLGTDWTVLRYNSDGSPDTTLDFVGDGTANSVAVQSDGKIVTAGVSGSGAFQIARHASGGTIDTTFSGDGVTDNTFAGSRSDTVRRGAVQQADGKIVVFGTTAGLAGDADVAITRYNVNGTLDASFGTGGRIRDDLGASETVNAVTMQSDGKFVVAGTRNGDFFIARYNANGSIDSSFGTGGYTSLNISGGDNGLALAVQPDGKFVVAGSAVVVGTATDFALARFNTNGSVDTTFDGDGKLTTAIAGGSVADIANAVTVQPDGKIVVAGSTVAAGNDFALARYDTNGALDTTFDTDGKLVTSFGSFSDIANAVTVQPDGKIVAVGQAGTGSTTNVFGLARYLANGALDNSFDSDGRATLDHAAGSSDIARDVILRTDGSMLLAGSSGGNFALAKVDAAGAPDTSFGTAGQVSTDFGATDSASSLLIQADGKIVAVGSSNQLTSSGNDFAIARYEGYPTNAAPTANANGPYSVNEGGSVVLSASGSSDPEDGTSLTYAWDLDGDNVFGEAGETGANPTFSAANLDGPSSVTVTLRVTDSFGDSDEATATINVNNVAPNVGTISAPNTPQGVGTTVNASANFTDAGTLDTHTATWDWGDGTSAGTVTESNGSGSVTGSHVYSAPGSYEVTLTVTDDDTASAQSVFQYVVVVPVNSPPTANANGPYSVNEGGNVTLSSTGSSDPDQAANTLTYTWDLDGDNVFGETGVTATRGNETGPSPVFSAANLDGPTSASVKLRVTDSQGASANATATVNVVNVAPVAGTINAPMDPQRVDTNVSVSATFTDAGKADTHTAIWNWGDSTTSVGTVTGSNGTGNVTGAHSYADAGVYTVSLTLTDDNGGATTQTFQHIVVYDPEGGSVAGGGIINSPIGAMPGNATATGLAVFAFVSRYRRGASVPTGETIFHFHVGNFTFDSTSLDWMVITGAKVRYRGSGRVNGGGNYGFQITAIDGQRPGGGGIDKFRIKIWNKNAGNAVVYDNQLGAPEDDDPVTKVQVGSIRIQPG